MTNSYGDQALWNYAYDLINLYGENCEYLTVVERAPDFLDREITEKEAQFVHDIVQGG